MSYNIILVSGVQHSDLNYFLIVKGYEDFKAVDT